MIVNSHYVPLQPPYPIIYCKGEVGMQIGTLIVVEGHSPNMPHPFGNREPPYAIRTHSHPVVSYGNKYEGKLTQIPMPNDWSEGIVWDRVELRNVTVLCYSDKPDISEQRFDALIHQERYNDVLNNRKTLKLSTLISRFNRLNVKLSFPNINAEELKVKIIFEKSPIDSSLMDVLKMGKAFLAPYLYILVRSSDDMDKMEQDLREQIDDYRAAIAPNVTHFTFASFVEEWKPLAERLNNVYSTL